MKEFNTDDLFKKILENPPPMRPDMEALEDMNRRLDAVKDKRKGVLWWWLVPLLLIPLLFSSIFFYFKFKNAKQEIFELNLQLTDNQQITKKDTLTQSITIYEYDTIFNTIYKDVYVNKKYEETAIQLGNTEGYFSTLASTIPNKYSLCESVAEGLNTFDKSSFQPSQLELLKNGKVIALNEIALILENGKASSESNSSNTQLDRKEFTTLSAVEKLNFLNNRFQYDYPLPPSDHFLNLATKTERDKINPLWYFVPTGFQLGFNWSPIGIAQLPGSNNNVKTIGLVGELEFTRNTRLQFGLDYLSVPLQAESLEELNLFPMVEPNNPDDILREIYGDFTYLQVPLTFKYIMQPDKKWRPTIGIGMIARLPLKEEFRHEFISLQGGEYTSNQPINDGSFSIANLRGTLGIDYNFYKNYTLQVEGFYNYQFGENTNPYFNLRYGGLNMGLKYKF